MDMLLLLEYEKIKCKEMQAIMKMAVAFSEKHILSVEKTELIMKVKGGKMV